MNFLLFIGRNHYPEGGFDDFYGCWSGIESALEYLKMHQTEKDWAHIVDINKNRIVARFENSDGVWAIAKES